MHLVGNVFVLNGFVQGGQAPESFSVVVRRVLGHHVGTGAVQRLAVLRNRIGEVPDHCTRLGIAKRMATVVLHEHTDHAARRIGLPVFAFGCFRFGFSKLAPPAELFEQHMIEFRVAGCNVGTLGV